MATLISVATGNLTAATTFALVDATSLLNSETAGSTLSTAGYVESSAFTPGAIIVDAIAVKILDIGALGTFSVHIATGGIEVPGTAVTVNQADIALDLANGDNGFVVLKFAAPVLLLAATAYTVGATRSVGSGSMQLYTNGTAFNYSRMLRTTTTQAPAAGDVLWVLGELTGAGTGNDITVTMDSTATTDYGAGIDGVIALGVGKRATLTYGTTAATNYYLRLSGEAIVYQGGVFNKGTTGTPIPRDSTAVIEFDPVADGGMGLIVRNGGTFTDQGLSRTSGKNITWCKLNTDEAIAQTTLGVDTDTGWLSGDSIVVGKTNRSSSQVTESKVLNGDAGATSMDITVGLATARSGTSPTQAHIGLLTRNSKFRSASSTIMTYLNVKATATVDIDWCEFTYLGDNQTGKRGIEVETTTGSFSMQYCSEYGVEDFGFITLGSTTDNITVDDNVFYALNNVTTNGLFCFQIAATSGANINIRRNFFSNCRVAGASQAVVNLLDVGINFSNNVINDTLSGASLYMNQSGGTIGTFDNNEISCSTSASGLQFSSNGVKGVINGLKCWFDNADGINFNATVLDMTLNDVELFGNGSRNMFFNTLSNVTFNRLITNSATTAATASAIQMNGGSVQSNVVFNDCQFSQASGIKTAHTQEILMANSTSNNILFNNCLLGAATFIAGQSSMSGSSVIAVNKQNQTANKHLWYTSYGTASSTGAGLTDTTVRTPGSLNVRIAPTDATTGFSWSFFIPATSNTTVSFQGFFQKNAAFGTDVATVSLFLPGSTVADSTSTLSNTTGSYLSAAVSAYYSGAVDGLATVTINAKTTTANAYLYCADFYNSGDTTTLFDKLAGLTIWNNGLPSPLITQINLGGVPSAVWAVATSGLTAAGTTGKLLTKLLTKIGAQIWT